MLQSIKPKTRTILLYLLVPVIAFVFTVFYPLCRAVIYSFYDWKSGPNMTFNGLANYVQLFNDRIFWESFWHNIYLVIVCIIGQMGIAFILVMFANSKLTHAKGVHRTFGFFPSTISAVCIGMIWNILYLQDGLLNTVLNKLGFLSGTWFSWPNYLGSGNVMLAVSIPLVWQFIGYYMVIMFSAIAGIDSEIFESAEIDGANGFQKALYITMPLIKNTLLVCLTLCISGNMKAFDNIYVMTNGGPGSASMVMAMYGYNTSFRDSNLGYGSTISVAIFVLSLAVIGGSQWLVKRATKGVEA